MLIHKQRRPDIRKGTTFYFTTPGFKNTLNQAKAAGAKNVGSSKRPNSPGGRLSWPNTAATKPSPLLCCCDSFQQLIHPLVVQGLTEDKSRQKAAHKQFCGKRRIGSKYSVLLLSSVKEALLNYRLHRPNQLTG